MVHLLIAAVLAGSLPAAHGKQETKLVLDVKPAAVVIYLDNKKLGTASKSYTVNVKPGSHQIRLALKKDRVEEPVTVKKGETKTWHFDMTDSGAPDNAKKPTPTLDSGASPEPGAAPPAQPAGSTPGGEPAEP